MPMLGGDEGIRVGRVVGVRGLRMGVVSPTVRRDRAAPVSSAAPRPWAFGDGLQWFGPAGTLLGVVRLVLLLLLRLVVVVVVVLVVGVVVLGVMVVLVVGVVVLGVMVVLVVGV
eukprot:Hpha_TRINITY_DN16194_c7_g4::TRINITY_DN16194_c7_g4_i1::g.7178::m.7178